MAGPFAGHHRILGNRADNRLSNRLLFCGTGNVPPGCHGLTHQFARLARDLGYIVTRHGTRAATLSVPVLYWQPALGPLPARIGWFLPDDDGRLSPVTGLTVPPEGLNPE
jgi:hypothetical protein